MGIVVIGTAFMDIKGFPYEKYFPTGRNAGRVEFVHGGVGRNVAEDIANVELRPTFVGLVDDDVQGDAIIAKLEKHKVNTDYIMRVPDGLGMWLAVFDNNGDLAGSISKRPDSTALIEMLDDKGDEIFSGCDSIVIEIDMDKEIVKRVLDYAEKYDKKVYALISNMSIAMQRRDFLQRTDCFICNDGEAGLLFADSFYSLDIEALQAKLFDCITKANIKSMIVTLGANGAVFAEADGTTGYVPAEKVKVVDTTGAGDCFCAGVSIGLTYGKTMIESIQIGTRLAASVLTISESVCARFLPKEFGLNIDPE